MTTLAKISADEPYDGLNRTFEDFKFDVENALTLTQLTGKSTDEKNAATVMMRLLANIERLTTEEVANLGFADEQEKEGA